jgi:uncharacterized membrane protein
MMMASAFLLLLLLGGFLLVLLVGGVFLARRGDGGLGSQQEHGSQTPKQILDQRLARGEISEEQYDEIRERIQE